MTTTSLSNPRSHVARQSLHLRIDPSPYASQVQLSTNPPTPSPSSARNSVATADTTPTSDSPRFAVFSVLCLYDFLSSDPDHLPFSKNEILEIVKQEETGWWAAMRNEGDLIGWIPQAFVAPLSDEMVERLQNVHPELRVYEYEAENLYNSVPYNQGSQPSPSPIRRREDGRTIWSRHGNSPTSARGDEIGTRIYAPPSPSTPVPVPPTRSAHNYDKPSPYVSSGEPSRTRSRSGSLSSLPQRSIRRQPVILDDNTTLSRLSTLIEKGDAREIDKIASPPPLVSFNTSQSKREIVGKGKKKSGSDAEWVLRNAIKAHIPWYLQPSFSDQLEIDSEGRIRSGTFDALAEKLSLDISTRESSNRLSENMAFINVFLMTFRTFITPERLFDVLVERFRMDHPKNVNDVEFEEWKSKCLVPSQRRVLTVFTVWLEDHRLLDEEPHIAQRMTDFLGLVVQPPLAITAKLIIQTIERLTFATPNANFSPRKPRKSRPHKNDLLKIDAVDFAEQLSLYEFQLYAKVTPQECLSYAKTHSGRIVANLCAFCATHDKLGSWVKTSILNNDVLSKRADTVDFWIKVAEKCRQLNNFASMSAIIIALSSTVITRLHLTWAHVGKKYTLDALLRHNEPTGGFAGYRNLLNNVEGPCVPFIGMFLTDMVHILEHYPDEDGRINFRQRQRWYDTVTAMLRYQSKPYNIAANESIKTFIDVFLREGSVRDQQSWFWTRSQELQQLEVNNADIRKGLERAGF